MESTGGVLIKIKTVDDVVIEIPKTVLELSPFIQGVMDDQ